MGADAGPYAVNGKPKVDNGVVTQVALVSSQLLDFSPLRAFAGLKKLTCHVPQGPRMVFSETSRHLQGCN